MPDIDLHIVAFDVPYPANYGGVIDVFYKIKSLSEQGIKISLHCFHYGREKSEELEERCQKVQYYPRQAIAPSIFSNKPTIVITRRSSKLLENLIQDQAPILFEGLHSCYYLNNEKLKDRLKLVRTHNVEHAYYEALANQARTLYKKIYYKWEAKRLKKFEEVLKSASKIVAISEADQDYFKRYTDSYYLPAFHSSKVNNKVIDEDFALYYGNLEVEENEKAARFLIDVFQDLPYQLIIAGKNPSLSAKNTGAIKVVANPSDEELSEFVKRAKVNCLPTFQSTGIKLKLIKALIEGNEVLVNNEMVKGNELGEYCLVANSVEEWREKIETVFSAALDSNQLIERREKVSRKFNNQIGAKRLAELFSQVR